MMIRSTLPLTVFLAACATQPAPTTFPVLPVAASVETDPMIGEGDRADDPAIWVKPGDPAGSLILGTNKDEGLHIYNLNGEELQMLPAGPLNNVDVYGPIAAASNDGINAISWFGIDPDTGVVEHVVDTPVNRVEPYGFCMGRSGGALLAAVTYKDGFVQIWAPEMNAEGINAANIVRTAQLETQLEGCAFDGAHERLFIGEEAFGVWSLDLSDEASEPVLVDTIANHNGLVVDVEGLDIWEDEDGGGYLVVSAQEADRFVVYDRLPPHTPLGNFTVTASGSGAVDAVSHTDGLDVSSAALPGYPNGLLVVQDDGNPESGVDQNFKLVSWQDVESVLGLTEE